MNKYLDEKWHSIVITQWSSYLHNSDFAFFCNASYFHALVNHQKKKMFNLPDVFWFYTYAFNTLLFYFMYWVSVVVFLTLNAAVYFFFSSFNLSVFF